MKIKHIVNCCFNNKINEHFLYDCVCSNQTFKKNNKVVLLSVSVKLIDFKLVTKSYDHKEIGVTATTYTKIFYLTKIEI